MKEKKRKNFDPFKNWDKKEKNIEENGKNPRKNLS